MAALHFSDDNFNDQVIKSSMPVVVDFYAQWCGPCKMAAPIVDKLADKYQGKLVIGKLDVDESPDTAQKFEVMSIPTMVVYKNGVEVDRKVGFAGEAGVEKLIESVIN